MPSPILDQEAIDNLRMLDADGGDTFLREIIGVFIEDAPQRIAEIDQSLASGDTATFIRAAHTIKGSSSNVGAAALRAAAEKLEHYAKKNGLVDVATLIADVKTEFASAKTALNGLLTPP
ncbi:MAG TPA: Hpt domain-containing protein [Opitutaceae bacterium]|jgi:HPt (histidine-containing phosphotransfer) domain-containing protein|nr:Hpt domain-containing protein [Opitutaceae bacterium]